MKQPLLGCSYCAKQETISLILVLNIINKCLSFFFIEHNELPVKVTEVMIESPFPCYLLRTFYFTSLLLTLTWLCTSYSENSCILLCMIISLLPGQLHYVGRLFLAVQSNTQSLSCYRTVAVPNIKSSHRSAPQAGNSFQKSADHSLR